METYLWKLVVCSAIFIGIYFLVFERQKNHHFKRFYLLMSLLFSLFIPLISITYGVQEVKAQGFVILETGGEITPSVQEKPSVFTLENTLGAVYLLVSAILIFRLCRNLFILVQETKKGEKIKFGNHFLILKPNAVHPYSFWNFIVLNKTDFENGKIDEKILIHEKAHLDQKHSFDVLFMEILLAVFWFNLAFYLYKKAIITNHEFLADDTVLKTENNIKSYQKLLLSELISERILFTHPFNLSNTKKRIKMMTTPKNNTGKYLSWISLPLSALLFFIFVEKVPAQIDKSKKTDVAVPVDENKMTAEEKELYKKLKEEPHQVIELRKIEQDTLKPQKQNKSEKIEAGHKESEPAPISSPVEKNTSEAPNANSVDVNPMYPGGINAFRSSVALVFNTSKFIDTNGTIKSALYFVINEDGTTSGYHAEGEHEIFNAEALKAAQKANENIRWTPAQKGGKPVQYIFKLPLTMTFESEVPVKKN